MIYEREQCTIKRLKHLEDVTDLLTLPRYHAPQTPEGIDLKPADIGSAAVQRAEVTYWPRPLLVGRDQLEGNLTTDTVYSLGVGTLPAEGDPFDYLICASAQKVTDASAIRDDEVSVVLLEDMLSYRILQDYR